jgi:hypothetical protein
MKLELSRAQRLIGTPANPERSGGVAAKNAVLNLSRIKCRGTAFKNQAS